MKNMKKTRKRTKLTEREKIIKFLLSLHPGACPSKYAVFGKEWSEYVGGFVDSGEWNRVKVKRAKLEELKDCYDLIQEEVVERAKTAKLLKGFKNKGKTIEEMLNEELKFVIDRQIIGALMQEAGCENGS